MALPKVSPRTVPLIGALLALALWLAAGLAPRYGLFIDEFYYVACSKRLDWGYVDHPPLAPALLALSRAVFGETTFALRFPAALAGACTVGLVGWIAGRLGAGAVGRAVACGATMLPVGFHVLFTFYSMNAFELLLWTASFALLVEIERAATTEKWLALGAVLGLGLLNKHTMLVLAGALVLGIVATPARRHLATRGPWLAALVALVIALPNVVWEARHDWLSLEFYRNADLYKNVPTPPWTVALLQVLFLTPLTLLVWAPGLVALLRKPTGFDLRHLGVAVAVLFVALLVAGKSRPDRIAGVYPLLFAAGGAMWEPTLRSRLARVASAGVFLVGLAVFAPLGLPVLTPELVAPYAGALGAVRPIEAGDDKLSELPQWLADRLGWEDLQREVALALDSLPESVRARAPIFAPNYGMAGAVEWSLAPRGVRVHSTHNSFFLWGPPSEPFDVAIVLEEDEADLRELFDDVRLAGVSRSRWSMPERRDVPIWICRGPRGSIAERWHGWKHFE